MASRFLLAVASGALAACGYVASFRDCKIECTAESGCPSGFSCAMPQGVCRSVGAMGSCPMGDAGSADGPPAPKFGSEYDFALSAGAAPQRAAVGDFDGDGKLDLAVVDYNAGIWVLANATPTSSTQPSFGSAVGPFAAGGATTWDTVADINADGKPDLVVSGNGSTIAVLLNTTATGSAPSFATYSFQVNEGGPIAIGDLNADGKPDLVVADQQMGALSVLLNTTATGATTPTFGSASVLIVGSAGDSPYAALGDIDGDSRLDIVVADVPMTSVTVLVNTTAAGATTPSFQPRPSITVPDGPAFAAIGDLNADGKPDLALGNDDLGSVSVMFDTSTPGGSNADFGAPLVTATQAGQPSVVIGDLNGDGKPDVAEGGATGAVILVNTTAAHGATPSFTAEPVLAIGSAASFLTAGDLNGDGKLDLVAVSSSIVAILLAE